MLTAEKPTPHKLKTQPKGCMTAGIPQMCNTTPDDRDAGDLLHRSHIPAHLPAIARLPVSLFDVGLEIHDDPFAGFEKYEIDHAFENLARLRSKRDREFPMDAVRLAGPGKH